MTWNRIPYFLCIAVAVGFLLPMRIENALIILFVLASIFFGVWRNWKELAKPTWFAPILFFGVVCLGMIWSEDQRAAWLYSERKLSVLVMPVAFLFFRFENQRQFQTVLRAFVIAIALGALYCLVMGMVNATKYQTTEYLFYHNLSKPLNISAIYFSAYCLFSLILLGAQSDSIIPEKNIDRILWFFLSLFLVLLASKLILGLWLAYIAYRMLKGRKRKAWIPGMAVLLSICVLVVFVPFIHKRIMLEINTDTRVLEQEKFPPNTIFSGTSLRLVLVRQSIAVIKDHEAWILGVGTGDFQRLLDEKYQESGMYSGTRQTGNRGFLGYNPHNQYVEILLTSGLLGLAAFIFWMGSFMIQALEKQDIVWLNLGFIFLFICITECFLSANKGITWFMFFYSMLLNRNSFEFSKEGTGEE